MYQVIVISTKDLLRGKASSQPKDSGDLAAHFCHQWWMDMFHLHRPTLRTSQERSRDCQMHVHPRSGRARNF